MRTYKRPEPPPKDPYQNRTAAGRSAGRSLLSPITEGQVGNVSTTLQTVNMVDHLERLGWMREQMP